MIRSVQPSSSERDLRWWAAAAMPTLQLCSARPDIELLTLTEMVDAVWRFADAVDLPLFADGDNGHGNTTNVHRTVKQFEKAGAASVMLEDQVSPKRCGHMSSKHVVPADEFVAKIRAAVDARTDQDLTILARTDAIGVKGLSEAVDRAQRVRGGRRRLGFLGGARKLSIS